MSSNKQGKMIGYINWRMRIVLNDGRQMTGQMLAFDKHMNLVLADTEEFRRVKRRQAKSGAPGSDAQVIENEEKRTLGLTIVRGAQIISVSVESPPPADPSARLGRSTAGGIPSTLGAGPGVARPAGRGAPPANLAGPAAGVGGGAPPPGFPGFPGGAPPAPFGRGGGPPPGFPGQFPPPGFPGNFRPPAGFPGGAPGGPPGAPPGFNPPPRK
ncbi:small nuclear ribonucleoprotein [Purpureocillium lilacinum]|uniref:Sm protein B n=1 Tax=Purpureocillium lilacinum TaxID=33203 RepID=A0A179HPC2_PURLI|nr:small nuclear ribonucleoprotein [Purpureocillium lilacinum]OAQ91824.1 small nuclear ribonucleoprotein [Purpureocillium lilacinum]